MRLIYSDLKLLALLIIIINEEYGVPSMSSILEPMAEPNTIKYNDVDKTGDIMLWVNVLKVRDISNL